MHITIECIEGHLLKSTGENKHMGTKEGKGGGKNWEMRLTYMHSRTPLGPTTSWEIGRETVETGRDFILGVSKSLQMVTAAMKLKDACSLEGKL